MSKLPLIPCLLLIALIPCGQAVRAQTENAPVTVPPSVPTPTEVIPTEPPEDPSLAFGLPSLVPPTASPTMLSLVTVPTPDFVLPPPTAPSLIPPRLPKTVAVVVRPHPPRPPIHMPVPPTPSLVRENIVWYGRSVQGRVLTAFVLDNGPGSASDTTLIFGGFHGNERTTPALVGQLQHYLKLKPAAWAGRRVVLVPCANPDGWAAATRVNAHQVDLNRNFPADWSCTGIAARNNPGPAAESEPETRAMIHLMNLYHPAKVVSLHSPLHCLNWTGPVGLALAQAMSRRNHYHATAQIGYPTPGSLGDYCGSLGIGIVTLELPQESEAASWAANRDAFLAAIQMHSPKNITEKDNQR
jgi:hypothetical protein